MQTCAIAPPVASTERHRLLPSLAELSVLLDADVNLALVRRPLEPDVQAALRELTEGERVAVHGVVHPGRRADVEALLASLPAGLAREFLGTDLTILADAVASLTRSARPRIGLHTVSTDACRKWHCDFVGLRLLVTYAGPGTLWAPEAAVDRRWLGSIEGDMDEVNARILRDPAQARSTEVGDVLVCKGDAFPGNSGRGAVHRSPPLAGTKRRLVLKIDDVPCGC